MSPLALLGRRPATIAFLITFLFARMALNGEFKPGHLRSKEGWSASVKIALCLGAASQCADELLLLLVSACVVLGLSYGKAGVLAWRKTVAYALLLAPAALFSGGFAAQVVLQALGATTLSGTTAEQTLLGVGAPAWPSFFGAMVPFPSLNWWRVAALEFGGGLLAPLLAWRLTKSNERWRDLAVLLGTLWVIGLVAAQVLRFEGLDYQVDLHRFVESSGSLGLLLLPVLTYELLARVSRGWAALAAVAVAALHIAAPLGQALDSTASWVPVAALVMVLGAVALASFERRRWLVAIRWAPAVLATMLVSSWLLHPKAHTLPPPSLPSKFSQWLDTNAPAAPVLSNALGSNWLLLQGRFVAAPHHRADLSVTVKDHDSWLKRATAGEVQRLGTQAFLLPEPQLRALSARWGSAARWDRWGRWPAPAIEAARDKLMTTGVPSQPADALVWGRVEFQRAAP